MPADDPKDPADPGDNSQSGNGSYSDDEAPDSAGLDPATLPTAAGIGHDVAHHHHALTTPQERKRAFGILFVCLLAIGMGQTLVFAVLPPIARELGLNEFQTTLIFSLSALLWVMTSAFWGRRSDVMGRKPVILIGLLGFGISTFLFALIITIGMAQLLPLTLVFPLMMLARAIFGTFGSGSMPASQAYVADRTTRAERASGVAQIGAAFGLGTAIGPGVAAAMAEVHILAPFYAVSLLAIGSAVGIWLYLPERTPPKRKTEDRQQTKLKLTAPNVLPWLIVGVLISFAQSISMQFVAFYFMDKLNVADQLATQYVSVGLLAMALATLFAQLALIQRFNLSVKTLLRWGSIAMITSFLMLVVGTNLGVLVSGLTLAGLGFGLIRPGLQAGASLSVSRKEQGAMAGLIGSTAATGHILNPFIGTPLYTLNPTYPYLMGAGLVCLVLAFASFHPLVTQMQETPDDDEEDELEDHEDDEHLHPH